MSPPVFVQRWRRVPQRINEEHAPSIRVMPLCWPKVQPKVAWENGGVHVSHSRLESPIISNLWFKANVHEGSDGIRVGHKLRNAVDDIDGLPMDVTRNPY